MLLNIHFRHITLSSCYTKRKITKHGTVTMQILYGYGCETWSFNIKERT